MSNNPMPSAKLSIQTDPSQDSIQWRDQEANVLAWVNSKGVYHYPKDGLGALPTFDAVRIFSTAGVGPQSTALLILLNSNGDQIGWINADGTTGGTLTGIAGKPFGWIDPSGHCSGSGPIGRPTK